MHAKRTMNNELYIPVWIDLKLSMGIMNPIKNNFTFQYG